MHTHTDTSLHIVVEESTGQKESKGERRFINHSAIRSIMLREKHKYWPFNSRICDLCITAETLVNQQQANNDLLLFAATCDRGRREKFVLIIISAIAANMSTTVVSIKSTIE